MFNCTVGSGQTASTLKLVLAIVTVCNLVSCTSPKQLVYFQNVSDRPDNVLLKPFTATIQAGDVLSIQVSSLSTEASMYFNPYTTQATATFNTVNPTNPLPATTGYLVALDSTITLPLVGKVVVAGQTNVSAAEQIRAKLNDYLKEPTVSVRNLNFRVTVLGEVNRPSIFNIANERITLPEVLGLAGDLTIYGRRDNVLIIREENGQRTYTRLNLTRRDVFTSPYYYLHPNDVVYVEPNKFRVASTDRFYQIVPIVLSVLSIVVFFVAQR